MFTPTAPPRTVEVLTIGDELLSGDTLNSNLLFLGERCRAWGLELIRASIVRDRLDEIEQAVRDAVSRSRVCLISGGLGPTSDDLTAQGIACAANVELVRRPELVLELEERFRTYGRVMPLSNLKQADLPHGAEALANRLGSAPGIRMQIENCLLFSMPGVPRELVAMMDEQVRPQLEVVLGLHSRPRRMYRSLGLGESALAERVEALLAGVRANDPRLSQVFVHYRARNPEVLVMVEGRGDEPAREFADALATLDEPFSAALAPALFGIGEADLPARLVRALTERGLTVAGAESCTAGGSMAALAAVPGASKVLLGGIVAYDNRIKQQVLGVPESLLARVGAVSEEVVVAMAEAARTITGADLAFAISGIAGPEGGSEEKPVGTVHVAVCDAEGHTHRQLRLLGNRGTLQRSAALWALKLVWDRLVERGHATLENLD